MILGSRFSEKILSTITEKCQNNDNIEEKYLEKYYILENFRMILTFLRKLTGLIHSLIFLKSQVQ